MFWLAYPFFARITSLPWAVKFFSLMAIAGRAAAVRAAFAVIFHVVVAETAKCRLNHGPGSALAVGSAGAGRPAGALCVSTARHDDDDGRTSINEEEISRSD
jgi:hypothetical protein